MLFLVLTVALSVSDSQMLNFHKKIYCDSLEQRKICLYLQKGERVTVSIEQGEARFYVSLFGPDDTFLGRKASVSYFDLPIMFDWTAKSDGDYSFLIDPIRSDGEYAVSLLFLGDHKDRVSTNKNNPRYLSIKKHIKPIRSIDPYDMNFSDFEFLKKAIGDKPYVFLGEQTHGESESMAAKVRLVKFLHQEMGFDVLAWEADLFPLNKLNQAILEGTESDDLWINSMNGNWSALKEILPMREYLVTHAQSERPLLLWGVDGQHTRRITANLIVKDLKAVLLEYELTFPEDNYFQLFQNAIDKKYMKKRLEPPGSPAVAMVKSETLRMIDELLPKAETDPKDLIWVQLLQNLSLFWENAFEPGRFKHRDQVMADNFYWLAKKRFPGKKIIFWAASSHLAKNRGLVRHGSKYYNYEYVPAGTILDKALPGEIYNIFCTALSGEFAKGHIKPNRGSDAWLSRMIYPNQHPDLELEEMMGLTGVDYGFLDITHADFAWLNEPAIARPFGNISSSAPWPQVTDSFFFIRKVSPVSYADWAVKWIEEDKKKNKKVSQ